MHTKMITHTMGNHSGSLPKAGPAKKHLLKGHTSVGQTPGASLAASDPDLVPRPNVQARLAMLRTAVNDVLEEPRSRDSTESASRYPFRNVYRAAPGMAVPAVV